MGSSQAYMSVRISVRPYVSLYLLSLCISCLSDSLSGRPHRFLAIISAACNCAQCMWPQITGGNPLIGSLLFASVRLSGRL